MNTYIYIFDLIWFYRTLAVRRQWVGSRWWWLVKVTMRLRRVQKYRQMLPWRTPIFPKGIAGSDTPGRQPREVSSQEEKGSWGYVKSQYGTCVTRYLLKGTARKIGHTARNEWNGCVDETTSNCWCWIQQKVPMFVKDSGWWSYHHSKQSLSGVGGHTGRERWMNVGPCRGWHNSTIR